MGDRYVLAVAAVVLTVLAEILVTGVSFSPESIVIPDMMLLRSAAGLVIPLTAVLLSVFLLRWSSDSRRQRVIYWAVELTVAVLGAVLLGLDPIVSAFIVATVAGGILPVSSDDPCKMGVWHTVSSPKSLGFALVLVVLIYHGSTMAGTLQPLLVDRIVELALTGAGSQKNILDVNQIIPEGITPEEREKIIESVKSSVPNWDSLSPEQQQELINQYLEQYEGIKKGIREALALSIKSPDENVMRSAIERQIREMPVFRSVFENVHYIYAFVGAMLYSIITLFAEWVAFVVAAVFKLVTGIGGKRPQG
ncbi:MAG: hypothetical protein PWP76_107 [Candidatus Diapherotrites archaeon]|nr:hypothetical protein [Candidatus Diapherotrites archaeon]MDN5366801.1 hypothetical protein [Candidatus Diapherotrites archaeon]